MQVSNPAISIPHLIWLGCGNKNLTKLNMNEDLETMEDLELAEEAEQEMEIIMNSIPDSRSFDIVTELIKRFRDKLTD